MHAPTAAGSYTPEQPSARISPSRDPAQRTWRLGLRGRPMRRSHHLDRMNANGPLAPDPILGARHLVRWRGHPLAAHPWAPQGSNRAARDRLAVSLRSRPAGGWSNAGPCGDAGRTPRIPMPRSCHRRMKGWPHPPHQRTANLAAGQALRGRRVCVQLGARVGSDPSVSRFFCEVEPGWHRDARRMRFWPGRSLGSAFTGYPELRAAHPKNYWDAGRAEVLRLRPLPGGPPYACGVKEAC